MPPVNSPLPGHLADLPPTDQLLPAVERAVEARRGEAAELAKKAEEAQSEVRRAHCVLGWRSQVWVFHYAVI